jgi:hypothetical protein
MTRPRISRAWLLTWIALLIVVIAACAILVWRLGLQWLGLAGPLTGFVGSIPAWIGRIVPQEPRNAVSYEENDSASALTQTEANSSTLVSGTVTATSVSPAQSSRKNESFAVSEFKSKREPGSQEFSDLVYALGRSLSTAASVYQVSELAGLNRGDLEDGFVNAPTRWYAALKLAVELELVEALCREAVRASPSRRLKVAVTAYLS